MDNFDSDLVLIPYLAEVIVAEGITDKVRALRFEALRTLRQYLNYYKGRGIISYLLYQIAEKKGAMLMNASTKNEVEQILTPRAPKYNGNRFVADEYQVPEEELICWSEASLRSPLSEAGFRRYMELFRTVFPEQSKEILKRE